MFRSELEWEEALQNEQAKNLCMEVEVAYYRGRSESWKESAKRWREHANKLLEFNGGLADENFEYRLKNERLMARYRRLKEDFSSGSPKAPRKNKARPRNAKLKPNELKKIRDGRAVPG